MGFNILSNLGWLVTLFALLWIIYQVCIVIYNIYFHPLAKFPGPVSRAAVHAVEYWHVFRGTNVLDYKALHEKYGDVVRTRPNFLAFNSAAAEKDIYGNPSGKVQLRKDPIFYNVAGKEGASIIYTNDADHTRMRKLLSHAFSDVAIRQQEELMTKYFDLLVERLRAKIDGPEAGEVELTQWYNFTTFDIISDLCFGEPFNALQSGAYHVWMSNVFENVKTGRLLAIFSFYQPAMTILNFLIKFFPSIQKARNEHLLFCNQMTARRLDAKTDRKDFMSFILRHNDERGMSREEILGTSEVLIIAGSETTATLLSGVTYLLLKHPYVYRKLKEEVRGSFKRAEDMTLISCGQLPYLQACLDEALRVYPPGPIALPRVTRPEGDIISGYFVPGYTSVAVSQFATSHNKQHFHEPDGFVPERWLPNAPVEYQSDVKDASNPFSYGPRSCIGKNLAYNEMRSVLARMIWHFDMQLLPESYDWMSDQKVYFLWDKPELKVKLSHRKL